MVGLQAEAHDLGISIPGASADQVRGALTKIAEFSPDNLCDIETFAGGLQTAKDDEYISEDLLRHFWKRRKLQTISLIPQLGRRLLQN